MDLYGDPSSVEYFREFMAEFPDVRFFHPSPANAPWHVIAEIPGVDGITRRAHFWPHKMKVCPEDDGYGRPAGAARIGVEAMRAVVAEMRLPPETAELFED